MADIGFTDNSSNFIPGEPFELVSDTSLGQQGSSNHNPSYSIEYSATGNRNEIRNLLADTFKINDTRNYRPSRSSEDVYLPNDYYCGRSVGIDENEFISIDIQSYLASDVSESGSTIKNYTTFLSRPEMWRVDDGGPELYEVTNIENANHFRTLPFDEVRMYETVWPGTQVGIATGIIYPNDKRNIYVSTGVTFSSQPTGCSGIEWVGFTTVYRGDLVHDYTKTATTTEIIPRNTRVNLVSPTVIGLNKDHTYVGIGSTAISFTIRRIGPSGINREYGYYFRHYDWEDPIHAYDGIDRPGCGIGGSPGYWQGENQHRTGTERYGLDHKFLSEYTYAFYYGKIPDGYYKKVYSSSDDPTLDINGNLRYDYNSNGRWGVYIDDEVKNYFEGRVLIGHNIGIGTGELTATVNEIPDVPVEPEPILSVFNNKWKNQQDEIDIGKTGNCIGTKVSDPNDPMQFQMGLFVEDLVGIGTRIDLRYRLNVDASENSVGIASTTVEKAAKFVGDVEVVGNLTVSSLAIVGSGAIPVGGIILWSGSLISVPSGWSICDGNNGTPDLRDRFVVGVGTGGTYSVGNTGGAASVTLTTAQTPLRSHTHNIEFTRSEIYQTGGTGGAVSNIETASDNTTRTTQSNTAVTSVDAHENRPPYYALAYIMRTT
jgi:hypothetical protein